MFLFWDLYLWQKIRGSKIPEFLWKTKGCEFCGRTGYRGQLVIAESFWVDEELKELILKSASVAEIAKRAREKQGMISFAEDCVLKVVAGLRGFSHEWLVERIEENL